MLPCNGNSAIVKLDGTVSDDGKPGNTVRSRWSMSSGSNAVRFGDAAKATTTAVLTLRQGDNDIWFGSKDSSQPPQLTVTAEDPGGR